jgi:hypothetical protein
MVFRFVAPNPEGERGTLRLFSDCYKIIEFYFLPDQKEFKIEQAPDNGPSSREGVGDGPLTPKGNVELCVYLAIVTKL